MATYPLKNRSFMMAFCASWVVWAILHTIILNFTFGFSLWISVTDSFMFNLFLAGACALISYIFVFYRPEGKVLFTLAETIAITGLWLFLSNISLNQIMYDQPVYLKFLSHSLGIRFFVGFLIVGWVAILSLLWYKKEEQEEHMRMHVSTEKLAREAELFKLRQQLQPHFLFNSLNSISALVVVRPEEARTMIQQLSDFLRGTLKKEENQWITAEEEVQYLKLYLEIEKVRFSHRLNTIIEITDESKLLKMPPMLLQPIVENAIKFGLYDTTDEVEIGIRVQMNNVGELEINVQNPYDAQTNVPQGTGFGLSSIARRLYLLFGRNDLLETRAENNVFSTTLKIPQTNDQSDIN